MPKPFQPKIPKNSTISANYLAKIGENAFPDVREPCPRCLGVTCTIVTVHGVADHCPMCRGFGEIVRTMTAREEHFWIIHLISQDRRSG